jgi:hypothetical protein
VLWCSFRGYFDVFEGFGPNAKSAIAQFSADRVGASGREPWASGRLAQGKSTESWPFWRPDGSDRRPDGARPASGRDRTGPGGRVFMYSDFISDVYCAIEYRLLVV